MSYPKQSDYPDIIDYLNAIRIFLKSLPSIPDYTDHSTNIVTNHPTNIIYGTNHKDNLNGTKYNDDIRGKGGNDTLKGLQGIDSLDGGNGNDTLIGGAGGDYLHGGNGNDTINGGAGDDMLDGGNGNDTLIGGAGGDSLKGDSGKDNLNGGAGNDALYGGNGNDTLIGGAGDDEIVGDSGRDILTGGTGKDTFILTSLSGDIVTDFSVEDDKIWLSQGADVSFLELDSLSGDLDASSFKIGDASSPFEILLYNSDTGVLSYDADGNGQGEANEIAVIGSHLELTYTNFYIMAF